MRTRSSKKPPPKTPPVDPTAVEQPATAAQPDATEATKRPRRPRDGAQLAWMVVAEATGMELTPPITEAVTTAPAREKNPHAVELGKLGGAKGGKARAAKLSPSERHAVALRAANARWGKKPRRKA